MEFVGRRCRRRRGRGGRRSGQKFDTTAALRLPLEGSAGLGRVRVGTVKFVVWTLWLLCSRSSRSRAPPAAPPGSPPARKLGGFEPDFGAQRLQNRTGPDRVSPALLAGAGSLWDGEALLGGSVSSPELTWVGPGPPGFCAGSARRTGSGWTRSVFTKFGSDLGFLGAGITRAA